MESGLPMLNCLLQHTLRSLCSYSDGSSAAASKWVYAVFWRILPRNYPPPKWDYGGGSALDRTRGNKRNWILVWEDGYCDFYECEQAGSGYIKGRFGPDVFFKMSHEVYSYGEGLVGTVAADNSHKWVFRDSSNEGDASFIASWNVSVKPQPRAWEVQFKSGIQTIAIISVREGIIQLGSFDKIAEDINLAISIRRKFSYLQSIPGAFALQRPYQALIDVQETTVSLYEKRHPASGLKRLFDDAMPSDDRSSPAAKCLNLGRDAPRPAPIWQIPPLLPAMPCSLGALLSKFPYSSSTKDEADDSSTSRLRDVKVECSSAPGVLDTIQEDQKPN